MNQQQKLLVAAGASAAVVIVLFFLYRKRSRYDEEYDDDEDEVKKSELEFADLNARESTSAAQTVIKLKVPAFVVGAIIGKNGSNIKQLKAEFGVRFDFEREDVKDDHIGLKKEAKERELVIRGARDKVQAAELKVKEIIAKTPKFIEEEILVPQEACGRIIGKGGQMIRELSSVSGAKITVDRNEDRSLVNQRRVFLSGTTMQVDYAKLLIEEKVEQEKAAKYRDQERSVTEAKSAASYDTIPDDGSYYQVFVSAFEQPNHLWVQLVSEESVKLDEMTKELTQYYGKIDDADQRLENGDIGTLCAAPFEHDEEWYRGCIKKVNPDSTVQLYYIDFGDIKDVHINKLKTLSEKYQSPPAHAIECYLDIKPSGTNWTKEAEDDFNTLSQCAQWLPLMAKVVGYKEIDSQRLPFLDLIDTNQNKDQNIGNAMITKGHAVEDNEAETFSNSQRRNEKRLTQEEVVAKVSDESNVECSSKDFTFDEFVKNNVDHRGTETAHNEPENVKITESVTNEKANLIKEQRSDVDVTIKKGDDISTSGDAQTSSNQDPDLATRQVSTSSDDFVDIDVTTVNGAITAIVSEHIPTSPDNISVIENERTFTNDETIPDASIVSELQKSLDETSRKNVLNSMELARENLMTMSADDVSLDESFVSARSDLTITDTDNASFMSAQDRLTPVNSLTHSLPDLTLSPYDNQDETTPKASPNDANRLRTSKFEIQFIDEKTNRVMSRESLDASFEASLKTTTTDKVGKETTV